MTNQQVTLQHTINTDFLPYGLNMPYRIIVGNNPVGWVDPWGLFEVTPSMSDTWVKLGTHGGDWLARQASPDLSGIYAHGTVQAGGAFHVGMVGLGLYSGFGLDTSGNFCFISTACHTIGGGLYGELGIQGGMGSGTLCEGTTDRDGGFVEGGIGGVLSGSLTSDRDNISAGRGLLGVGGGVATGYMGCRDVMICF